MAASSSPLTKRDAVVVGILVAFSVVIQVLAAVYFEAQGSLAALGVSALAFLTWVVVRFRVSS